MSDHPIRIGVIGCGAIARSHLHAYAELGEEMAIVIALCDVDEERLAGAAESWPRARTTRDFAEMLAPGDLDMVLVATMPNTHAQMAIAALEAGAHVFCEKPFATCLAEATAILDTAARVGRQVQLGTNMRYIPSSLYLRDLVASGEVGDPLFCRASAYHLNPPWWGPHYQLARSGGGVLASTLVHVLDLGMWIAGSPNPVSATWEVEANWQRSINDENADVIARLRRNQPWTQHDRRQLLNLQHIIDACYESARTGRQIELCNSSA